jgi:adenine-specific DNA glycosylase
MTEKEIGELAQQLLPQGRAYEWNQALMDYAAMELKKEKHPQVQKQSRFKDSDRYYRGKIIRLLLSQQSISQNEARQVLHKEGNTMSQERFDKIIKGLVKDSVIQITKDTISLASL